MTIEANGVLWWVCRYTRHATIIMQRLLGCHRIAHQREALLVLPPTHKKTYRKALRKASIRHVVLLGNGRPFFGIPLCNKPAKGIPHMQRTPCDCSNICNTTARTDGLATVQRAADNAIDHGNNTRRCMWGEKRVGFVCILECGQRHAFAADFQQTNKKWLRL